MSADAQGAVEGEKTPNNMDKQSCDHKIDELFADAYKLFNTHSYELAADKFSESTELAVKLYGQFAPECFKHHYYYGRSLLEISREEQQLIDDTAKDQDNDTDSADSAVPWRCGTREQV
ncbi:NASP (Nuclear Autoantigenic Sperm Protein) like protein [Ditylenchus destructor]|nr:NASP (Nuclear Autoantigenic Sperm Protein) like protein [Ditylenchus destructor]